MIYINLATYHVGSPIREVMLGPIRRSNGARVDPSSFFSNYTPNVIEIIIYYMLLMAM